MSSLPPQWGFLAQGLLCRMLTVTDLLKYLLLVIFLFVVLALVWILRDGFTVRQGGSVW